MEAHSGQKRGVKGSTLRSQRESQSVRSTREERDHRISEHPGTQSWEI